MPWNNGPVIVYHGCDDTSAKNLSQGSVDLAHCKTFTDFGKGFYTTTNLRQAKNSANARCRMAAAKMRKAGQSSRPIMASVVEFTIDRTALSSLASLCFVWENSYPSDYWDLVSWCRNPPQRWHHGNNYYDVVYGPVSLWPQTLVIKDCDQISFHTYSAVNLLNASARRVSNQVQGNDPTFPLFP